MAPSTASTGASGASSRSFSARPPGTPSSPGSAGTSPGIADPRIGHGVQDVGQQRTDHRGDGGDEGGAEQDGDVGLGRRLDGQEAHARGS